MKRRHINNIVNKVQRWVQHDTTAASRTGLPPAPYFIVHQNSSLLIGTNCLNRAGMNLEKNLDIHLSFDP